MKNIDKELIDWAIKKIKIQYPEDVALLIGQVGGCKIPTDEQNMAFDFFIPATERGNHLAQTFIIEDMGYDLYPISWERLEGIANFKEPRMIFAFDKGEIIYARNQEDRDRYNALKNILRENLNNLELTFKIALEFLGTAMESYHTMLVENSLCKTRKISGDICCYLMNAIAMMNGTYLQSGYRSLSMEMKRMQELPENFSIIYHRILLASNVNEIQKECHLLIKATNDFLSLRNPDAEIEQKEIFYNDLAEWYQEARYTFRRIAYYVETGSLEECFLAGCYLQSEFDDLQKKYNLKEMDLLSSLHYEKLEEFANQAKALESYLTDVIKENNADLKIYNRLEDFLQDRNARQCTRMSWEDITKKYGLLHQCIQ